MTSPLSLTAPICTPDVETEWTGGSGSEHPGANRMEATGKSGRARRPEGDVGGVS